MTPRDDEDFFNNISSHDIREEPLGSSGPDYAERGDTAGRWERDIKELDEADWESYMGGPDE